MTILFAFAVIVLTLSLNGLVVTVDGVNVVYYIAAEEREWDYAPLDFNMISGEDWMGMEMEFVESGPERIGKVNRKVLYIEYTDASFAIEKSRPASLDHLGLVGPLIRASVGDTIQIHFKNNASQPFSMHPHGVRYDKESEGAKYNDGFNSMGAQVPPGSVFLYNWMVPESAGPAENDPSSIVWPYHSHTNEVADPAAGLIGMIVICRKSAKCGENRDGLPQGVDREFFLFFYIIDENASPMLDQNIEIYTENGNVSDMQDEGFMMSNMKHAINGYLYGNQPLMTANSGETVRWYVVGFGNENDLHTVHWHGQTLVESGHRKDTIGVGPAEFFTLDMKVEDNPGVWLLHCHTDMHMEAGMMTLFSVETGILSIQLLFSSYLLFINPFFLREC